MAEFKLQNPTFLPEKRSNLLLPVVILWGITVVFVAGFLLMNAALDSPTTKLYLLPWVFATGIVIVAPNVYLYYKGRLNLFNPIVFAAWSYFFPAFFIGGLILCTGLVNPYFLSLVRYEEHDLPLTMIYIMLGYAGLSLGFLLPFGRRIGEMISQRLPEFKWTPNEVLKPGLVLLGLGLANTLLAFSFGLFGFQRVEEIGIFDGIVFMLTFFWTEALFLLWLAVFRADKVYFNQRLVIAILLATSLVRIAFQGNRGGLISLFILVSAAFVLSRRKIQFQHKVFGGVLLVGALVVGMIYGTTFRSVKTTEEKVSIDQYASNVAETFGTLTEQDLGANLERGFGAMGERLENVSQLAVVVSNYEALAGYEADYGLDNNIYKDSISFLIPRIFWADKPVATDPYKYSELYFNNGENSFTLTPMGDLLRNFGPIGIPLGMILLGFLLRVVYSSLIENQDFSFWRTLMYYMLLMAVSYEGSYGLIIPFSIKVIFITLAGLSIVAVFLKLFKVKTGQLMRVS